MSICIYIIFLKKHTVRVEQLHAGHEGERYPRLPRNMIHFNSNKILYSFITMVAVKGLSARQQCTVLTRGTPARSSCPVSTHEEEESLKKHKYGGPRSSGHYWSMRIIAPEVAGGGSLRTGYETNGDGLRFTVFLSTGLPFTVLLFFSCGPYLSELATRRHGFLRATSGNTIISFLGSWPASTTRYGAINVP
jgi:hypothetical protein